MPRLMSPEVEAHLAGGTVYPALLVYLDFPDDPVRAWSGVGSLHWGGHVWHGVGQFGGVSGITDTLDLKSQTVDISLSGIPLKDETGAPLFDTISTTFTQHYQGRAVEFFYAVFTEDWALVPDPVSLWLGRMDAPTITLDGSGITVSLSAEHEFASLTRPRVRHYSDVDLRERAPGDKGLEFVSSLQEILVLWGKQKYD
ncbi:hypothetical protein [Desulfovibrio oxyclinae]|uniref:hypothetical protein n=1 Tax=Desulfovibrio oxyclinae TaxID=63560 RepID=UPI00036EE29E|nr:hypothetical protein [Desulfovibrio oxyclinae]